MQLVVTEVGQPGHEERRDEERGDDALRSRPAPMMTPSAGMTHTRWWIHEIGDTSTLTSPMIATPRSSSPPMARDRGAPQPVHDHDRRPRRSRTRATARRSRAAGCLRATGS